ncbi:MAG: MMPL family transporter [Actinobacteria bacterium]|nr:MMPL family transporter [Actinomycetota bacterium]
MGVLSTRGMTAASARHPWRTIVAWLIALVLAFGAIVTSLEFTSESDITAKPDSEQAYDLLGERVPPGPPEELVNEVIIVRSGGFTVDHPRFRRKVTELADEIAQPERIVTRHFYDTQDRELVSRERRAALITVGLLKDAQNDVKDVIEAVKRANDDDFETAITGEWTYDNDLVELSQHDLEKGELQFGLPAALLVLLIVFGAVIAGLVPMLLALISIVIALGLVAIVSQFFDLSIFTLNMLSGMGLALGVDYALFVVSRFREERARGLEKQAAIEAAGSTASRAVVFSGFAFVLSMCGLLIVPDTIFRSLATGAILVGLVSVVGALTLLPAMLSLLGDRINALRLPFIGRSAEAGSGTEGRFWSAIVRAVMRRPALTLVASVALLLALSLPVLDLKMGFVGVRALPDRFESKQGFAALEESFGAGTADSAQVVVDGDVSSPGVQTAIRTLESRLRSDDAFLAPETTPYPEQRLASIEALLKGDSRDDASYDAVRRVRSEYVPESFRGVDDARVLVTGETAEGIDYFDLMEKWMPIVFVFVLGLSFVLLMVAFRSVVVPIKAILLNLLSVGAAYGLLVLVFQKGIGNELLGFQQVDAIEAWVPLFLFAVLFGLSMDYHVFLLSRIRELYSQTGDNTESVAHGVASTARMITGAALIIIAVFSGFAVGDTVAFQQMGFGVAVSLLLDATIVRSVLLPASMKLLGDWNWYLPKWLHWIPDLEVEGNSAPR